jgi:acetyl esterase
MPNGHPDLSGASQQIVLHPQAQVVLDMFAADAEAEADSGVPAHVAARRTHLRSVDWVSGTGEHVAEVVDLAVPGDGGPVPIRIYRPQGARPGALMYLHGGGWVVGGIESFDAACRALANRCRLPVVSVDYRLAPENPFPAAVSDCLAVAEWISSRGGELHGVRGPLVVAGDSAGGHLASLVAFAARDRGGSPSIEALVLVYPIIDATMSSESFQRYANGYFLTAETMRWYWRSFLGARYGSVDSDFSPAHRTDVSGLPRTLVITAEHDVLRDEGEAWAARVGEAGVDVTLHRFPGMIHGFFRFDRVCSAAGEAYDLIGRFASERPRATSARARALSRLAGRVYLERGKPVTVLLSWTGKGPRNVLIRRADGTEVVRPFRGLRRPPEAVTAPEDVAGNDTDGRASS